MPTAPTIMGTPTRVWNRPTSPRRTRWRARRRACPRRRTAGRVEERAREHGLGPDDHVRPLGRGDERELLEPRQSTIRSLMVHADLLSCRGRLVCTTAMRRGGPSRAQGAPSPAAAHIAATHASDGRPPAPSPASVHRGPGGNDGEEPHEIRAQHAADADIGQPPRAGARRGTTGSRSKTLPRTHSMPIQARHDDRHRQAPESRSAGGQKHAKATRPPGRRPSRSSPRFPRRPPTSATSPTAEAHAASPMPDRTGLCAHRQPRERQQPGRRKPQSPVGTNTNNSPPSDASPHGAARALARARVRGVRTPPSHNRSRRAI